MSNLDTWITERIFHCAREFYAAVLEDVGRARQSIDLEVYIFDDDALGRRVADALKTAAQRKVAVRVMADGFGAREWATRFIPGLLEAGVDARVFRPMPWALLNLATRRIPRLRPMIHLLTSINRRNHRKVWIIDGQIAYVGSINITAHNLSEAGEGVEWRDTAVRVEGEQVAALAWGFGREWTRSWRFRLLRKRYAASLSLPKPVPPKGLVRLNERGKSRHWLFNDLLHRISSSERRVWITNPYFIPARRLVRDLCMAAERGVDVRLLVPRNPDVAFVRWASAAFFKPLLHSGARIFEYLPHVLHAKLLQIDDWATIGTSNLNHRSLIHDLEVDLVITHEESKASLERQFLLDLRQSVEITSQALKERSWLGTLAGQILRLFHYWM
ncbi:MAG: phospholipase D-like domain-containing protein [Fibrobacterota bacterium]